MPRGNVQVLEGLSNIAPAGNALLAWAVIGGAILILWKLKRQN